MDQNLKYPQFTHPWLVKFPGRTLNFHNRGFFTYYNTYPEDRWRTLMTDCIAYLYTIYYSSHLAKITSWYYGVLTRRRSCVIRISIRGWRCEFPAYVADLSKSDSNDADTCNYEVTIWTWSKIPTLEGLIDLTLIYPRLYAMDIKCTLLQRKAVKRRGVQDTVINILLCQMLTWRQ